MFRSSIIGFHEFILLMSLLLVEKFFQRRQWKQINQLEHDLLTDAWKFHLEKM